MHTEQYLKEILSELQKINNQLEFISKINHSKVVADREYRRSLCYKCGVPMRGYTCQNPKCSGSNYSDYGSL